MPVTANVHSPHADGAQIPASRRLLRVWSRSGEGPTRFVGRPEQGVPAARDASSREAASLAPDGSMHLFDLWIDFDQAWSFERAGLEILVGIGDVVMADLPSVAVATALSRDSMVELLVGEEWLGTWMQGVTTPSPTPIQASQGWGGVLSSFLKELRPQMCVTGVLPPQVLADNLGSILALISADGAESPRPVDQPSDSLNGRVRSAIRHRASTPRLTANDVAVELGISERTMHRVLAAGGERFASLLARYRIDVARRMLESGTFDNLPVGEIGSRAGFTDPSYFVRTIVRALGKTPSRYREDRSAVEAAAQ